MSGGVTGGHDLPVGLGLVVDVLGAKVNLEGADSAKKHKSVEFCGQCLNL